MKICFWGTFDNSLPRYRVLKEGLELSGHEIVVQNIKIWDGINKVGRLFALVYWVRFFARLILAYLVLLAKFLVKKKPDLLVVSYLGHFDVFVIGPVARLLGVSVVWDVYISLYVTVVEDRKLVAPNSFAGRTLYWFEWLALRIPNKVYIDTRAHATYLEEVFRLANLRIKSVPVGCESLFYTKTTPKKPTRADLESFRVLFYGTLIPLHGIEKILHAISLSKNYKIEWLIVGNGQESGKVKKFLQDNPDSRLKWIHWLSYSELISQINDSHCCLGIFGESRKADSVIPNKLYQSIASFRPVITRSSCAIKEIPSNFQKIIRTTHSTTGEALLEEILKLKEEYLVADNFERSLEQMKVFRDSFCTIGVAKFFLAVVRGFD